MDYGAAGRQASSLYQRKSLAPGFRALGPALIEEPSSTTVVLPGQSVTMDSRGLLVIEEQE